MMRILKTKKDEGVAVDGHHLIHHLFLTLVIIVRSRVMTVHGSVI